MARTVPLNNVDHKDLRVVTARSARLGDSVMTVLTFPGEFRNLQAHYPIVFHKSSDGQFQPVVLFGFKEKQNLFLTHEGWDAAYVPLMIERQPFLIGRSGEQLMVHVDLESPRITRTDGEAVFLPHGGNSDFLERMNSVLLAIHEGIAETPPFIAALLKHDLLESFVFDIRLADGTDSRLTGFYVINEENLAELSATALAELNRPGYLQAIYMAVASLSNFRALIERQNRLNAGDLN